MSMMNINELVDNKTKLIQRKLNIYDEILKKCHHRIKLVSKQNPMMCYCLYIIPKFIYGVPLFKLDECIKYLFEKLTENGFKVNYTHPNLLIISWHHIKQQNAKRVTFNTNKNEYRKIDSYVPSQNLIYNKSNFDILSSKTNKLLN